MIKDLPSQESKLNWKIVGISILCLRFVQGWIFWGGGSRRFFYDPNKLDPYSTEWMANKLQSAMPGALLGMEQVIAFLLQHFVLLYAAILLFSLAELLSGIGLIVGLFTRLFALITVLISISLMLIFGWQGSTCMDEWTMAVANLAIGFTLLLSGSPVYSVDSFLLQRYPTLQQKKWYLLLASGAWSCKTLQKVGLVFLSITVLFTLATYNYYRGAIFSKYHSGPVSSYIYHLNLTEGSVDRAGRVQFNLYVDAGPSAAPIYIIRIELVNSTNKIIEEWARTDLSSTSNSIIQNNFLYNQIKVGPYGIIAPVSARANIKLFPSVAGLNLLEDSYQLQIYTVDGKRTDLMVKSLS